MAADDRYRLAPIRDARARDERVRRGDLAAAVGDARGSEATLAHARARTATARTLLDAAIAARATHSSATQSSATQSRATPAALLIAERYVVRRRRDLDAAIAEELHAEAAYDVQLGAIDGARRILARARADREIIERHFARWRDARHKLAERRED